MTFRTVSQIATLAGYIVLIRGIPADDFGILSLLYAFIPVVSAVASLGLAQVLGRYQPEYLRAGNKVAAAWLVRVVASGRFIANIVVISAILLAWDYVAPIFKLTPHRLAFVSFSLLILLYFQASIMHLALSSHMLQRYSVGSSALLAAVKLVLYGTFSYTESLTLETVILTDTTAYLAAYILMTVAYRKKCLTADAVGRYRPEPAERKRMIRYGLLNNFNDAGVMFMYSTLDTFFLAAFVSTTAVGIYSFYSRLSHMVAGVLPAKLFANIVHPLFFSVAPAEADRKLPMYFSFLMNMSLLLQWPALTFSLAYHAELVQAVFGGKFVEHSWLLPVIMGFGFLNTISEPSALVAHYEEKVGIILLSKLFAFYNLLAMAVLVPLLGLYGAALAAGTTQIMKNAFIWWHVRRRAVWKNAGITLLIGLGLWGAAGAVAFGLKLLLEAPAVIELIIGVAVLGATALLYVRSAALSGSDRQILAALAPAKATPLLRLSGLLPRRA